MTSINKRNRWDNTIPFSSTFYLRHLWNALLDEDLAYRLSHHLPSASSADDRLPSCMT